MITVEQARNLANDASWASRKEILRIALSDLAQQVEDLQKDAARYRVARELVSCSINGILMLMIEKQSVDQDYATAFDETLDAMK